VIKRRYSDLFFSSFPGGVSQYPLSRNVFNRAGVVPSFLFAIFVDPVEGSLGIIVGHISSAIWTVLKVHFRLLWGTRLVELDHQSALAGASTQRGGRVKWTRKYLYSRSLFELARAPLDITRAHSYTP